MTTKNIKKSLSVVNVCNRITKKHPNFPESNKLFITLEGLPIFQYSTKIVSIMARILTFHSQKTTLKVPKNTKENQKFRVKELGAFNRKTKQKGTLYLKANVILPKIEDLDEELLSILEAKLPEDI